MAELEYDIPSVGFEILCHMIYMLLSFFYSGNITHHTSLKVLCIGVKRKRQNSIYRRPDMLKMRRTYIFIGGN
jgi:hypothetical protein